MSQYTEIFVRKNDEFIEISSTGRGSVLSEMFEPQVIWEKIRVIPKEKIKDIYNEYKEHLEKWRGRIDELREMINRIQGMNNSIEDKLNAINDYESMIEDDQEMVEAIEYGLNVLTLLQNLDDEVDVYVGLECGPDVTVDDVTL